MCRRRQLAAARRSVEQPHHALHHRDVRTLRAVAHERRDQLRPAEERVQVAPRPRRRQRVMARVDVVRAHLEALHREAARPQCADQPARDRRLARARARARDHHARDRAPLDHAITARARRRAGPAGVMLASAVTDCPATARSVSRSARRARRTASAGTAPARRRGGRWPGRIRGPGTPAASLSPLPAASAVPAAHR